LGGWWVKPHFLDDTAILQSRPGEFLLVDQLVMGDQHYRGGLRAATRLPLNHCEPGAKCGIRSSEKRTAPSSAER
jgi:hypothetical protein